MKYQENHLKLKHPVQYETGFFTTTPPSSLFSYAAFLDLPSHLDDTKMAAAARRRRHRNAAKMPSSHVFYLLVAMKKIDIQTLL